MTHLQTALHSTPSESEGADPSVCRLSPDDGNSYFFGYYEKSPYDLAGEKVLAGRASFQDRMPSPDDVLTVGFLDVKSAHAGQPVFTPLADTRAWCWQQGTMLQWLPPAFDRAIIFNDREGNQFCSRILDITTGETRTLSRPVYAVDPQGRYALSLNFARLARTRPGYGYEGGHDEYGNQNCPDRDGLWRVPLDGGEPSLILSLRDAARLGQSDEGMDTEHWFNHVQVNPDGSRAAFLHRWRHGPHEWRTRLITVNPDGSDPHVLANSGFYSHYDWIDRDQLVGWTDHGCSRDSYLVQRDRTEEMQVIGDGILDCDGHMSLSPDGCWMLSDTYPDQEHMRTLFVWPWRDGPRRVIGKYFAPPSLEGPIRVDLHPRWRRDGRAVCIDSAHQGVRGMYEILFTE